MDGTYVPNNDWKPYTTDAVYKLFDNLTVAPNIYTGYVNTADASFQYASLKLKNISTTGDVIIDGDLTVYGSTVINVSSLSVESNLVIANSGPANIKPDAGFVINRDAIEMVTDDPKITGIASASGTTTTIMWRNQEDLLITQADPRTL
jgi:hypothetical protein